MLPKSSRILAALGLLLPVAAHAHPAEPGHVHVFMQGVLHPLTGIDHLVFMLALGIYAAHLGRRFAAGMGIASTAAMVAGAVPFSMGLATGTIELGVLASLALVGVALISTRNVPALVALPVAIGLSYLHGLAHGESGVAGLDRMQFIFGLAIASSALFTVAALIFGWALMECTPAMILPVDRCCAASRHSRIE
jgi:urease accessory protein